MRGWGFSYFQKGVTKQCFQEGETNLTIRDIDIYHQFFSYIVMTTRHNAGANPEQINVTCSTWIH